MINTNAQINLSSQVTTPIIQAVQGDTGRSVTFVLSDLVIPSGAEATYYVAKPSGECVYNIATISGNNIICDLTAQSLAENGHNHMQIRISVDGEVVTSFEVDLLVRPFRGMDAVESTSEMNIFDKAVKKAKEDFQEAAQEVAAQVIETIPEDYTALSNQVGQINDRLDNTYQFKTVNRSAAGSSGFDYSVKAGDTLYITNDTAGNLLVRLRESSSSSDNLQNINIPADTSAFATALSDAEYISLYFNASGNATIKSGQVITLQEKHNNDITNIDGSISSVSTRLNVLTGASEVDISGATTGGYLYDGSLYSNSASYKHIDITLGNVVSVYIVGTTANNFCLYHFLNSDGNIISSNPQQTAETSYNILVDVPSGAVTLRYTFQYSKDSSVSKLSLTGKDEAVITKAENVLEIDLANAKNGGYLYDGSFNAASTSYKYARIAVKGYKKIRLKGTTANAFCLYRFIDGYGNTISSAPYETSAQTAYDVILDIPLTADILIMTFNKTKSAYAGLSILSEQYMTDVNDDYSYVHNVQKSLTEEWCLPFINVGNIGCGYRHIIPETATLWSASGTRDLTQINALMRDGVHPFLGDGVVNMYGADVAKQFAMIPPSYVSSDIVTSDMWQGKTILWLGTSIPAGSDPSAGSGVAYPSIVAQQLGATVINQCRGSSCVRINSSQGDYKNMYYPHFLRSLSRMVSEVDNIVSNWETIYPLIDNAPSTLSSDEINIMKLHSFENLLLPYLDGTYTMPDAFVIDHGHNDRRPKGADGGYDMYLYPSYENLMTGIIAEDEWMTSNNYTNLKTAFNSNLDKVGILQDFACTLNRNTFRGAMNFIITLILRYNPKARIIIISEYN